MKHWRKFTIAAGLVCGAGTTTGPVLAQSESGAEARARSGQIEEIVVTAQKREESVQDIAVSVSAFGGDFLRNAEIDSLQDVGNRTPGMTFSAFSVGQPEIAIRGITTKEDGAGASDATVVSIDDVYIAARTAQVFDIFDLERIEVLRGPQGTLYGKNTIAGAINFVTAKPTEQTVVRLRQTFGNFERFDTAGLISGQIADTLFGKFSFSRRKHDGFIDNVLREYTDPQTGNLVQNPDFGDEWGERNTFNWRTHLRWEPTDDYDLTLMIDGADDSLGASNREPFGSLGPLHDCGCTSDPIAVNVALGGAGDPHSTLAESEGFTEREVLGVSLKQNLSFDFATWTTIVAFRDSDFDWLEDSEGLPPFAPVIDLTGASGNPGPLLTAPADRGFSFDVNDVAQESAEQFTVESRLSSPGGERFDWLAGIFYSDEEIDRREDFNFPSLGGPNNANSLHTSLQSNEGESWALFSQATYNINPELALTGGLRFSYDEKTFTTSGILRQGIPLLVFPFGPVTAEDDWQNVSWRVALDYNLNENALLYGLVSTGYKSGGFVGSASTAATATMPFEEETATNFEIGFKSDLFERQLRLNVTAFFTEIEDLQVTRFFQPATSTFGEFFTENAGEAESRGVEIEFTALPLDGLEIGGSFAYLDGEFTEFQGLPSVAPDGTIIEPGNFNGNELRQAPDITYNLYGRYTYDANWGRVWGRLDFRYSDEFFFDPSNNPISRQPSYDIWDARVAYETGDGRWQVSVWGKNLADEEYVTHIFTQRGGRIAFATFGEPRTYGVSVEFNY